MNKMVEATVKGVKFTKLTTRQVQALRKHAKHHTKKHMEYMKRKMGSGLSFTKAHVMAMKKVGK